MKLKVAGDRAGTSLWRVGTRILCASVAGLLVSTSIQAAEVRGRIRMPPWIRPQSARIELVEIPDAYRAARLELRGASLPVEVSASPDPEGRFRIETRREGPFELLVRTDGFVTASYKLRPLVGTVELPELVLEPARRHRLQLVDTEGAGIADALVRLRSDSLLFRLPSGWAFATQELSTDEGGWVEAWVPERSVPTSVSAAAQRFATLVISTEEAPGVLEMKRLTGRRLIARMADEEGRALEGVVALDEHGFARGVSDETGRLAFRGDPGETVVLVSYDGQRGEWTLPSGSEPIRDGLEIRVVGRRLRGLVTALGGEPLEGAWVGLVDGIHRTYPTGSLTQSDARGEYEIVVFDDWTKRVEASAVGWLSSSAEWREAAEGDDRAPHLVLSPAVSLTGLVSDEAGTPISGAKILLVNRLGLVSQNRQETATSEDGGFEILGLTPRRYGGVASADGYARLEFVVSLTTDEPTDPLELTLRRGLRVSGRVVDALGVPVEAALVRLMQAASDRFSFWERPPSEARDGISNESGEFEIDNLLAGRFDLVAQAPGFARMAILGIEVSDQAPELSDVVLERAASVEGRVVDSRGRGLEGVQIMALLEDEVVTRSFAFDRSPRGRGRVIVPDAPTTDDRGRFALRDLAAGQRLSLMLLREGYARLTVEAITVPPERPLRLRLEREARLSGHAVDDFGVPMEGMLSLRSASGSQPNQYADLVAGSFLFESIPPGSYRLAASEPSARVEPPSVSLAEGEVQEGLEVTVHNGDARPETARLHGRVIDVHGAPVTGGLSARQPGGRSRTGATIDSSGAYAFERLSVGPTELSVQRSGGVRSVVDVVDLVAGGNEIDLLLDGFVVAGSVVDESGEPLGDAIVSLGDWMTRTRTDRQGRFTLRDVSRGEHTLTATREGWIPSTAEELMVSSDLPDVRIVLRRGGVIRGLILGLQRAELARVEVRAQGEQHNARGRIVGGGYEIRGVAPGEWIVRASLEGEGRAVEEAVRVEESGGAVEMDLEFGVGWAIRGQVVRDGRPVSGLTVLLKRLGELDSQGYVLTDPWGGFRFEDLGDGAWHLEIWGGDARLLYEERLAVFSDVEVGEISLP